MVKPWRGARREGSRVGIHNWRESKELTMSKGKKNIA